MVDIDISEMDRGSLAMLAGVGFIGIVMYFYFFLTGEGYEEIYPTMVILILFSSLSALFYLFEDLNAMFNLALSRDDPDEFRTKVKRGSNFLAGMLLMGMVGMNLVVFTNYDSDMALRMIIITLLTLVSVFLLLYSMFMAED
ncbi:MAG: hypothetical protein KAT70_03330 [Thermoplasmata archaeon]|nr:hypothetical protein [Thermoplasmata archaeon]